MKFRNPEAQKNLLVMLVFLATLGSGLVILFSLLGHHPPHSQHALLPELFPLEVRYVSHFPAALIGFALIISSINIRRRKKRAYQIVLLLGVASFLIHVARPNERLQAASSLFLVLVLLVARSKFTVRSGAPNLRESLVGLSAAFALAIVYGVAGFWLLDEHAFGINFTFGDGLRETLTILALGDPPLVPHTRHALWFLDSLKLVTITALVYSLAMLFRPVVYRYRTHPREREHAEEIVKQYGRSSLDFFKLWPDKAFFFSPSGASFLAYGVRANCALVLGDPVGPEYDVELLVRKFQQYCSDNDWRLAFYQTLPDFLPMYTRAGLRRLKIGDDAIVDLRSFSLEGKEGRLLRSTVRKFHGLGIHPVYYEPPLSQELLAQLREISDEWLQIPGRRERQFTLGRFEPGYVRTTAVLAASDAGGKLLGFMNVIPTHDKTEAATDLMRRRTSAPNGVMDFLFVELFALLRQQGYERFNMAMAPMSGFADRENASAEERAIHTFFQQLNFLFSFRGLRHYKAKFATCWEPRYAVYRNVLDLPRMAVALRMLSEFEAENE